MLSVVSLFDSCSLCSSAGGFWLALQGRCADKPQPCGRPAGSSLHAAARKSEMPVFLSLPGKKQFRISSPTWPFFPRGVNQLFRLSGEKPEQCSGFIEKCCD